MSRPIFLLTDFGLEGFPCRQVRAVLARPGPGAQVVDVTHSIEPHGNIVTTIRASQAEDWAHGEVTGNGMRVGHEVAAFHNIPGGALAWHVGSSGFTAFAKSAAAAMDHSRGKKVTMALG